ncbi:redoxin domain-containing protein [Aerococcaceae bacterium WS4759]|uniref:Redoxin domain-containing protein n=1 Tax=Fundicoccus ignavus TaxID=2664442 RepID=A0A6I2GK23_9LACT|nr:TlpA disulfide reductase family protein [Fundicoccus ignavus]MRI85861.1 redoxin domain-containing protein [Fundicoccus ignavus]
MKKLLLLITMIIVLFGGAFYIYQSNSVTEEVVTEESSIEISPQVKSDESHVATSSTIEESEPMEEESKGSIDITSNNQPKTDWEGPSSIYLNTDGDEIDLSENYGKGTLINIWASWCEPCKVEMPYFEEAYQTYGDDINFLMINATESKPTETQEAALTFADEMDLSMPIYFDTEMSNQYLFGATILPLTVILDAEGHVEEIVRGQVSPAKLTQLIEQIL